MAALLAAGASADSATVSYQGILRDATLTPVADGAYLMAFSIWDDATAGTKRWGDEVHNPVPTKNGMFSVYLGSIVSLGTVFLDYPVLWLEISADTGDGVEVYAPRVPLASVPYAQHARSAWSIKGNAALGTDFIGTTNAQALIVKTDNVERMRVTSIGRVGIGQTNPGAKLEVGGLAINEQGLRITESDNNRHVFIAPHVGAGGYNPLSQSGDSGIFFKETSDSSGLVIAPWIGTAGAGMRLSAAGNLGIGTGTPSASAKVEIASTTQGFAMPRMTTAQRRAIASPVAGLMVYDINLKGFYFHDGAKWDCVSTPAGTVAYFARNLVPNGWLECAGQTVSTTTYPELFAAISYTYGGSGTNFVIPNLRGEFIRGWDNGRGLDSGRSFGTVQGQDFKSFSMQNANGPTYSYSHGPILFPKTGMNGNLFGGEWAAPSGHIAVQWDGSEIRPRNFALMPCIKY
ncbi:MAG TPA: phage tail protein [Candidatus Hydrogenedentes bacterium]|nr:phage tail protein [Candidatus Hydrogenedentota bacterium]